MSRFAAAVVKLFTLDLYDDAELERKKTAAMFAMFITSPAPETALDPAEDDLEVEPGQVVRLDPGEDVTTPSTPDSGSTYEPFQYRTLLQIGAALGVPYGYLTCDTAKGNFSNTRIALVDFRRRISAFQHSVMVYQLCRALDPLDGHGHAGGRYRYAGLCNRPARISLLRLAPHEMGLDRPGEGRRGRDPAD